MACRNSVHVAQNNHRVTDTAKGPSQEPLVPTLPVADLVFAFNRMVLSALFSIGQLELHEIFRGWYFGVNLISPQIHQSILKRERTL